MVSSYLKSGRNTMVDERLCSCQKKHQLHLCVLRSKEKTREIGRLTNTPNVICYNCGEGANSKANVCLPVQLFI